MECSYYSKREEGTIICLLCPHRCIIGEGNRGICAVRSNRNSILESDNWGVISSMSTDPVEKKPLYHFFPGMNIFSVGSYGCNLTCAFCQNHDISQVNQLTGIRSGTTVTVGQVIGAALSSPDNCGIAFTYNEPVVWIEFMLDIAVAAHDNRLMTAMVTNGYISSGPLDDVISLIDAFNIDLKAFNNSFYRKYTGSSLKPVLNTISTVAKMGRHLEITMLVIDGVNDNPEEFRDAVRWIADNTGKETPLHLSRYFPRNRMSNPPTSGDTLKRFMAVASETLDYVYLGNIPGTTGQDTVCPSCHTTVTRRTGYTVQHVNTGINGECRVCGNKIYRKFNSLQ